jgi:hypothetical protein
VQCACAAHDYGEDVYIGTWPVVADGIYEGCVFGTYKLDCLGEVVVRAIFLQYISPI